MKVNIFKPGQNYPSSEFPRTKTTAPTKKGTANLKKAALKSRPKVRGPNKVQTTKPRIATPSVDDSRCENR
jgi:hypothetical protein